MKEIARSGTGQIYFGEDPQLERQVAGKVCSISEGGEDPRFTKEAKVLALLAHPNIVPYQTFNTADGAIILACGNDNLFKKFCEVAGCVELTTDLKFSTNAARVQNRVEITALLNAVFVKRTTKEWVKLLDDAGVANGPINNLQQVFEEPQVIARGMKIELPHAVAGKVSLVASPMRFSGTPIKHEVPPPALGQHTDEILRQSLKKSDAEIAKLKADGVV